MKTADRIARYAQPLDDVKVVKPRKTTAAVKALLRAIGIGRD